MREDLSPATVHSARWIAVAADLLQIVLLPAFFPGALSPASTAIDVVVAALMIRMLGWHWAFLPTFVAEATPFLDLVPTWTGAVFLVTRNAGARAAAVVVETTAVPVDPPRSLPAPVDPALALRAPASQPRRDASGE
jgi:hypothetical protein